LLARLARYRLLVLDDWAINPLSAIGSREILKVVDDRSQNSSTLPASQLSLLLLGNV
jgi:DNA replication protein DnaC